jgi:hypothetical protein
VFAVALAALWAVFHRAEHPRRRPREAVVPAPGVSARPG